MAKWFVWILVLALYSCGNDKGSLSGDAPVDAKDFVAAFPDFKLPKTIADTSLEKTGDTTTISSKVLTQFIPVDAIQPFAASPKTRIRPVGRIKSEEELYLLTKFTTDRRSTLAVFVFDNDHKYLASRELLSNRNTDDYSHAVSINREPTFTIAREKITRNNQQFYTRTGYAFNKDAGFMVVVKDSNEDQKKKDSVLNPIDTFQRKNTFSGDYIKDNRNFISIRDGRNANTYLFFVHFEKNKGECVGELKGEMKMTAENTGQYTANGDPCVINFKFSGSQIQIKEEGSCGNHRGIKCFFDDRYSKKKEAKPKSKRK